MTYRNFLSDNSNLRAALEFYLDVNNPPVTMAEFSFSQTEELVAAWLADAPQDEIDDVYESAMQSSKYMSLQRNFIENRSAENTRLFSVEITIIRNEAIGYQIIQLINEFIGQQLKSEEAA